MPSRLCTRGRLNTWSPTVNSIFPNLRHASHHVGFPQSQSPHSALGNCKRITEKLRAAHGFRIAIVRCQSASGGTIGTVDTADAGVLGDPSGFAVVTGKDQENVCCNPGRRCLVADCDK